MRPITANYHTHCYLCDGTGAPSEYLAKAVELGFDALGFSSHAPLSFPVDWVMRREDLGKYVDEVNALRSGASVEIEIFLGLEIDYIPGELYPVHDAFPETVLDYVIGSVHFVRRENGAGHLSIDGPIEEFSDTLERGFDGDIRSLVETYYGNLIEMLCVSNPDVLGHIDVVRKNNGDGRFFDTAGSWYREAVAAVVDEAARRDVIVEINTGALARGYENMLYPEPWIVSYCGERKVRMAVGSDAHHPDHLGSFRDTAFSALNDAGYTGHWALTGRDTPEWRPFPIE